MPKTLEDYINPGDQPSIASMVQQASASVGEPAPVSEFAQLVAGHNDLLKQLHYGNAESDVSELGSVMRLPSEIQSGKDFLTGNPISMLQSNTAATPTPNIFSTRPINRLTNRRDTRYDAMQARQPSDPMIADPISGIAPQNAKVIKPIKPVMRPGVSTFAPGK